MKFLVVDDSESIAQLVRAILEGSGHSVEVRKSSVQALNDVQTLKPDVVLLDLMMPEMDGFEVCRRIRENPDFNHIKIVILSGKAYEFDRRKAKELGADGYIVKPIKPDTFMDTLNKNLAKGLKLSYWGTRGTLPVPGEGTIRYGGNTSCVTIEVEGEPILIFDAGSGIKKLGNALLREKRGRLTGKIFISHPHWDHINALPFFVPLYIQGNEFEIIGCPHGGSTTRDIMSAQMDDVYFPVTIREFGARVYFRDINEETLEIGDFKIRSLLLSHPGNCLGYRVEYGGKSVCYITDNEIFPKTTDYYNPEFNERLIEFVRGTDILITDTTYLDSEYPGKITWGHSCVSEVVDLAHQAGVKALHLFHHDPDHNDDKIDLKLAQAREKLQAIGSSVLCECPPEGFSVVL